LLSCWRTEEQSAFEQLSTNTGRRISIEHLLLTSSSAILFGFSSGWTNINSSTAASPERYLQLVIHSDFKLPARNLLYLDTLTLTTQYKNLL
jgi:hypothetical protein